MVLILSNLSRLHIGWFSWSQFNLGTKKSTENQVALFLSPRPVESFPVFLQNSSTYFFQDNFSPSTSLKEAMNNLAESDQEGKVAKTIEEVFDKVRSKTGSHSTAIMNCRLVSRTLVPSGAQFFLPWLVASPWMRNTSSLRIP